MLSTWRVLSPLATHSILLTSFLGFADPLTDVLPWDLSSRQTPRQTSSLPLLSLLGDGFPQESLGAVKGLPQTPGGSSTGKRLWSGATARSAGCMGLAALLRLEEPDNWCAAQDSSSSEVNVSCTIGCLPCCWRVFSWLGRKHQWKSTGAFCFQCHYTDNGDFHIHLLLQFPISYLYFLHFTPFLNTGRRQSMITHFLLL